MGELHMKPGLETNGRSDTCRTFGCIAYAKRVGPGVTKLSDESVPRVSLGYEPGSKAYRVFDLVNNKLMVTRDVIFYEKKRWNWEEKRSRESIAKEPTFNFNVHYPDTVDGPKIGPNTILAPDLEDESAPLSPVPSIPSPGVILVVNHTLQLIQPVDQHRLRFSGLCRPLTVMLTLKGHHYDTGLSLIYWIRQRRSSWSIVGFAW